MLNILMKDMDWKNMNKERLCKDTAVLIKYLNYIKCKWKIQINLIVR